MYTCRKEKSFEKDSTKLDLSIYQKPNNKFLYTPATSAHPPTTLTAFISGEARRFTCLSSDESYALATSRTFANHLHARGYTWECIISELAKISYNKRAEYLTKKHKKDSKQTTVALVLEHNPQTEQLGFGALLHKTLQSYDHLKPVVSWKCAQKLQAYLGLQWP